MARTEARIYTSIWRDADFLTLDADSKLVYFRLLSDPALTYCGIVGLTPGAWAHDLGIPLSRTRKAIAGMTKDRFLIVDNTTDELMVRSLIKNDQVLKGPNLIVSMAHDFLKVRSAPIRKAILKEIPQPFIEWFSQEFPKALTKGFLDRFPKGFLEALPKPTYASADAYPTTPLPHEDSEESSSSEDEDFEAALDIIVEIEAAEQTARGNPPKTRSWFGIVREERRTKYRPLLATRPPGLSIDELAAFLENPDAYGALCDVDRRHRATELAVLRSEISEMETKNDDGAFDDELEFARRRVVELGVPA